MTTNNEELQTEERVENSAQAEAAQNPDNGTGNSESVAEDEPKLESPEKNADSLEAQLEAAQARAEENWEALLRARAEMDNLRRRHQKDLENAHKFGIEKLVQELLPVIDSMDLGLAAQDASAESLREGMELTMNMLKKMMDKLGIEEINPMHEKFDPERHQAMSMQESAEVEPNTVIAVMQKGYALNDRLVRPAMVMVSKRPQAPDA